MITFSICYISVCLSFLLILLLAVSDTARYRIKFATLIAACILISLWSLPFAMFRPGDFRNTIFPNWQLCQVLKLLGVKYVVRGQENLVKDSGVVIVANHQSGLDIGVASAIWRIIDNGKLVVKRQVLWWSGHFGLFAVLVGTIFIDKGRGKSAQDSLNAAIEVIKRENAQLFIFPEGTRHSGSRLIAFKKGAFHVAIAAQVPVQPVVVSKYHFINHELKKFNSGTVYITILPPISTVGLGREDLDALVARTHELMNSEFQRTSQRVLRDTGEIKIDHLTVKKTI